MGRSIAGLDLFDRCAVPPHPGHVVAQVERQCLGAVGVGPAIPRDGHAGFGGARLLVQLREADEGLLDNLDGGGVLRESWIDRGDVALEGDAGVEYLWPP